MKIVQYYLNVKECSKDLENKREPNPFSYISIMKLKTTYFYTAALLLALLFACAFSQKKATKMLDQASDKQYDMVIIPGIPYEDSSWNRLMRGRIYWAKYLYERGIVKRFMFSGSAVYTPHYESKIMAMYAAQIGIPDSVIYVENMAEHSTENAFYGKKKSTNLGLSRVALASDPFQTKQLNRFVRKELNKEVDLFPFVFDTLAMYSGIQDSLFPDPQINDQLALDTAFVSIKERESFFKRLWGTMGKNINYTYYENGELHE